MASFSDTVRCTRCLEEISYMPDPRILPCSHIYCTECLETISNTVDGGLELQCFQCGNTHQLNGLGSLAVVEQDKECQKADLDNADIPGPGRSSDVTEDEEQEIEAEQLKKCARCTDREPVCFCIECGERYCKLHEELHNNWYVNQHKFITMDMYLMRPNLYLKPLCTQHKQEIMLACRLCFSLLCGKCDTTQGVCRDGFKQHEFESLRGAETILKAQFHGILAKCSERLTNMAKEEKNTWQTLDLLNEECAQMKQQVKEKVKKQIKQIQDEGDLIVQDITAYEARNTTSVEKYLQHLRYKRETLEVAILSCRQFLRENHVSKIIRYRKDEEKKLHEKSIVDFRWDHILYRLQDLGSKENCLLMEFLPKPLRLEYMSSHDVQQTHSTVSSICSNATGDGMYLAGTGGVTKYKKDMTVEATLEVPNQERVTSVISYGNHVYFITRRDSYRVLMKTSSNLTNTSLVTTFVDNDLVAAYITLTNGVMVVSHRDGKRIHSYNLDTGDSHVIPLDFAPRVVATHNDGDLLITDTSGVLHKCKMINDFTAIEVVWSYSGLHGAYGVCTMDNSLIIVHSRRQGIIHVVSPQGNMIQMLEDEEMKHVVGGICIVNDVLYLPCWERGKFLRYNLTNPTT